MIIYICNDIRYIIYTCCDHTRSLAFFVASIPESVLPERPWPASIATALQLDLQTGKAQSGTWFGVFGGWMHLQGDSIHKIWQLRAWMDSFPSSWSQICRFTTFVGSLTLTGGNMPAAKKARIESYADHKGLAGRGSSLFCLKCTLYSSAAQ